MKSVIFQANASVSFIVVEPNQRIHFYGADFMVGGTTPPVTVQFLDTIPTLLSPAMDGLLAGQIHSLPVMYSKDGFPVPRATSFPGSAIGVLIVGGTTPTVRGTFFYDAVQM